MLNFPAALEHLIPINLYLTILSRSKFIGRLTVESWTLHGTIGRMMIAAVPLWPHLQKILNVFLKGLLVVERYPRGWLYHWSYPFLQLNLNWRFFIPINPLEHLLILLGDHLYMILHNPLILHHCLIHLLQACLAILFNTSYLDLLSCSYSPSGES